MNQKTKEFRQKIADEFVKCLSEKQYGWKKGWKAFDMPQNAVTGGEYNGINRFRLMLYLMSHEETDPRFATFHQIQSKDWHLKKGAKGLQVEYWMPFDKEEKKYLKWQDFKDAPQEVKDRCILTSKYFCVFHANDIEGIPPMPKPVMQDIKADKILDTICKNMDIEILNDGGDRAFYRPSEDKIHLPIMECFKSDYDYNSVAMHELSHATGAPHRLDRNISGFFASESYAYEELVAEISSAFMGESLQSICSGFQMDSHKAYIQSWISRIQEKPDVLISAIKDAEKAADYLQYKAELLPEAEYKTRSGASVEITISKDPLMVKAEDIKKAGYKPTKKLVNSMNELNRLSGRQLSLKEIMQLSKSPGMLLDPQVKLVENIVKECQRQEIARACACR